MIWLLKKGWPPECCGVLVRNRTLMDILLAKFRVGGKLCVHVHAHRRPQPIKIKSIKVLSLEVVSD